MRTLMVVAEMGSGGAEAVVADLATHRLERGDEVAVATGGGWRTSDLAARGVEVVPVPLREASAPALARSVLRLGAAARTAPPALVHAHNVRATLAVALALRATRTRAPLVATVHGLAEADYARATRVVDRCADVVVAVSDEVAERLREHGLPAARLRVVDNAAPPLRLVARAEARSALGLSADVPVALCAARLVPQKRQDLLVDAWSRLPAGPVLLLAGDGPGRADLERRVADAGLGDRVRVLGDRRDVGRLLSASDAFLLASQWEGLPVSVLEAMSAGVPVVASAVGGLPTLGEEAVELVREPTPEVWAAAVQRVLEQPRRRQAMVAAATGLVESRFSLAAMTSAYDEVYEHLTRRRPVGGTPVG